MKPTLVDTTSTAVSVVKLNIYEKLLEARVRFHQAEIKKSGWNDYGKYAYFELADFIVPLLAIFNDLRMIPVVSFTKEVATLTIIDLDKLEDRIEFTSPMGGAALKATHEIQQIGAVETYQRRYLYIMSLDIVEHDAIDSSKPIAVEDTDGDSDVVLKSKDSINKVAELAKHIESQFAKGNEWGAFDAWQARKMDEQETVATWGLLGSTTRSTLKLMKAEADKK